MNKVVIFDLDGTLWDSIPGVIATWNAVFQEHEATRHVVLDRERMAGLMGKTMPQIGALLFPELSVAERRAITDSCAERENDYLRVHGGTLYPGLEELLTELKKSYRLSIVSNCQNGYIDAFLDAHGLWQYFDDFEMSGRTGQPKGENIRLVLQRGEIARAIYVGDTDGDEAAARIAGIPFVWASYGFGAAAAPDRSIRRPAELLPIAYELLGTDS